MTLPPDLRLGAVHLIVSDLERSVAFYEDPIGLLPGRRDLDAGIVALGAGGEDLLVLHEDRGARPAGRHAGLYHFALLFPDRAALARALARLAATRTPISGASDHGVSEAIYLNDPDGNGIELYADRPRSAWPAPERPGERVGMYTIALDLPGLLATVEGAPVDARADPGLVVGHLHLHVSDLAAATAFYRDEVGFEVMTEYPGAVFVSAGGYHHHLGFNVWRGEGVPPVPPHAVGLREWTIRLPDGTAEERELTDPSGNVVRIVAGSR